MRMEKLVQIFKSAASPSYGPKKVLTLTFVRQDGQLLLGMKKRGMGKGKWNGFGGKVEAGETVTQAAIREVEEECGLEVKEESLHETAIILQRFKAFPELLEIHVFQTSEFLGEIRESDEMTPKWFKEAEIPYKSMWVDDALWYPFMLQKQRFRAYYSFTDDSTLEHQELEAIKPDENFFPDLTIEA